MGGPNKVRGPYFPKKTLKYYIAIPSKKPSKKLGLKMADYL